MRAWTVAKIADAPLMSECRRPDPGPGEVLVRVEAAGLNFADLLMIEGRYQDRSPAPFTLGLELAGTIAAFGPQTTPPPGLGLGARVAAHVKGSFAEYAVVPLERLVPVPDQMPASTAAAFLIAYGTSHLALSAKAQLQPGETLFVTGASGGVGLTAVEIGHQLGARVIASVRGAEKAAIARAAGADLVIDSSSPDLKQQLRALGGIDVTYDTVGGSGFDAAMRATRPGGRMLAIGFAGGEVPQVPLNQLLVRNITVIGLWFGGCLVHEPAAVTASLTSLMQWWQQGRIKPLISATLPFEQLPKGLEQIRSRQATGKLVLRVAPALTATDPAADLA